MTGSCSYKHVIYGYLKVQTIGWIPSGLEMMGQKFRFFKFEQLNKAQDEIRNKQ